MNFLRTFLSTRKRVRQRATRYSLLVVVLLVGLFLEAYMHNFNLVYITLFFVFAAAFAAGPIGVMNIGKIEASYRGCSRLFARRDGRCRFEIVNTGDSPAWGLELRCAESFTELPALMPGSPLHAALVLTPRRRGRMTLSQCRIESLFPLATVRFVLPVKASREHTSTPSPKASPCTVSCCANAPRSVTRRISTGFRATAEAKTRRVSTGLPSPKAKSASRRSNTRHKATPCGSTSTGAAPTTKPACRS